MVLKGHVGSMNLRSEDDESDRSLTISLGASCTMCRMSHVPSMCLCVSLDAAHLAKGRSKHAKVEGPNPFAIEF